MEASYRVKIEGRLLDDDMLNDTNPSPDPLPGSAGEAGKPESNQHDIPNSGTSPTCRFSHFFKSLSVDFDHPRFPSGSGHNVEWKKPEAGSKTQSSSNTISATDFDELTFKRNGDENMNIVINLYRHESPERYQFSPELEDVIDMHEGTQQEAVGALWEYVRFWNLQEDEEKRNFRCDELLKKVLRPHDTEDHQPLTPMLGYRKR